VKSLLRFRLVAIGVFAVPVLIVAACGNDDSPPNTSAAPSLTVAARSSATAVASPTKAPLTGDITVFAAASLTDTFKEAGKAFEKANPGTKVAFNFASSSALATQINEGAPADVFASADSVQMQVVTDKGNATAPALFATNLPVVVVPKSASPVQSFSDLAKPGTRLVLAGPEVPIGKYARDIFINASKAGSGISPDFSDRVLANLKSNEANVRAVLTKVQLGEADAGIVYSTDASVAANDVKVIQIPTQYNVIATYPIAALKGAKNASTARAWVVFILGADGQAILAKYGFGKPQ